MSRPTEAAPALIYKEGSDIILDGEEFDPSAPAVQTVYSATVTLTDAQIKALRQTAVEVVPTPGVGNMVIPLYGFLSFDHTADYDNINVAAALSISHGAGGYSLLTNIREASAEFGVSSLLASGGDFVATIPPVYNLDTTRLYGFQGQPPSQFANKNLVIEAYNASDGDFTMGNAANTLKVTVVYTIIPV